MKTLRGGRPLPGPVFEAKAQWMEAIQNVQAKRKDEIMNAATAEATFAKPVPPPPMLLHENHHHKSLAACNGVNGIRGFEDKALLAKALLVQLAVDLRGGAADLWCGGLTNGASN